MDKDYKALLKIVKEQIGTAQVRTIAAANKEMLLLYWKPGQLILMHQANKGWGAKVIDLLCEDIKKEFPKLKGFSVRNLKYMRKFASEYPLTRIEKLNELFPFKNSAFYRNFFLFYKNLTFAKIFLT